MTTPVPTDLREQMDELWFAAAGNALTKNESTLAFVPMSALLGEHGYLESLRKRGYEILAPGIELACDACEGRLVLTLRRCALLCVILGAHLLLFSLISVNDNPRSVRRSEEPPGILFFVDLPKPNDTQPSTHSTSKRPISTYDPSLKSRSARDNTITLPPEIEGTDALIDWDAEASRVAIDVARRIGGGKEITFVGSTPSRNGPTTAEVFNP